MPDKRLFSRTMQSVALLGVLSILVGYVSHGINPLLSHNIAETFSVVVACGIFMMTWNARRYIDNHYYLFLGISYLFVGVLDYVHALSFDGLFPADGHNLHAQLWFAGRYLQSAALIIAPAFADRKLSPAFVVAGLAGATVILLACILAWGVFPTFFTNGTEATDIKYLSELAVAVAQGIAIGLLFRKREQFDGVVFRLLVLSIMFSIASGLAGELYSDALVYNNLFAHYMKIVSFYLVYRAVIATGLRTPYDLLFRNLKRSEEEIRAARDGLETRVAERTAELTSLNDRLERELAERRRAEEAARESEDRFRSLVENSLVGILIVQEGRVVFRNPEPEHYFGPIPEGIAFRELGEVHAEDKPKFDLLCEAIAAGTAAKHVADIRFFTGGKEQGRTEMKWIQFRTSPIEFRGRMAAFVNLVDITRVKDLEQSIATREKLATLGQLAAGIAHEIRNPLSGINVNISVLQHQCSQFEGVGPEDEAQISATVGKIRTASERIASVIRRVMEFSKPAPPKLGLVDVNAIVDEAIQLSAASLRGQGIELLKALAPDLPMCHADSRLLEQVMLNLVTNAIQAMENAEGRKLLEVTSLREGESVVVMVADSGPGVPVNIRDKIFDPLYTTRRDGHGIGLSFSHRVITDHGGSLGVSSSRWGGAEFRIRIPLARAAA